jgi:hypothetical protein
MFEPGLKPFSTAPGFSLDSNTTCILSSVYWSGGSYGFGLRRQRVALMRECLQPELERTTSWRKGGSLNQRTLFQNYTSVDHSSLTVAPQPCTCTDEAVDLYRANVGGHITAGFSTAQGGMVVH